MNNSVRFIDFPYYSDHRGHVYPFEFEGLPFAPQRIFFTTASESGIVRGQHGHFICEQVLFSLNGSIVVKVMKEGVKSEFCLEPNGKALYIPAGIWASQLFTTGEEILGCIASHVYDPTEFFSEY